jgi:hypothetical protein
LWVTISKVRFPKIGGPLTDFEVGFVGWFAGMFNISLVIGSLIMALKAWLFGCRVFVSLMCTFPRDMKALLWKLGMSSGKLIGYGTNNGPSWAISMWSLPRVG